MRATLDADPGLVNLHDGWSLAPKAPGRPANQLPGWACWPTVAEPRPGRPGWLTLAQTWRANGGRW
ncbi:hypothetical protein ACQPYA_30965 [Micromonospora sp. CA-263727]|uniref:hypothetical protein n=1 Tax=Micromonospora sp. CA-263727 TaxID=3239967 RepID=UPI003D8E6A1C